MLERRNRTTGPRYISSVLAPCGLWKHTHVKLIIEDCKKCPGKWWTPHILPYQNQLRQEWRARNPSSYVHLTGWRSRTLQVGARWNPTPQLGQKAIATLASVLSAETPDRCRALLVEQMLLSNITVWLHPPPPPGPFIWRPFLCNQSLKPAGRNYTPISEWSFILSGKVCWYETDAITSWRRTLTQADCRVTGITDGNLWLFFPIRRWWWDHLQVLEVVPRKEPYWDGSQSGALT